MKMGQIRRFEIPTSSGSIFLKRSPKPFFLLPFLSFKQFQRVPMATGEIQITTQARFVPVFFGNFKPPSDGIFTPPLTKRAAACFPSMKSQSETSRATTRPCLMICTAWPCSTSPRKWANFLATKVAVAYFIMRKIRKMKQACKKKAETCVSAF